MVKDKLVRWPSVGKYSIKDVEMLNVDDRQENYLSIMQGCLFFMSTQFFLSGDPTRNPYF